MASRRRIVLDLFRIAAGIPRREMASSRRIKLSTAVRGWRGIPQWSSNKCPSIHCNKYRHLSTHTREIEYTDVADLLSSPERNYLVRNHNGQKVPVASLLKRKVVGLYFCEYPDPPRLEAIQKVYEQAQSRGLDFEIVQITFNFDTKSLATDMLVEPSNEDILWLTLPCMDLSFTKIRRIFQSTDEQDTYWAGDSLVLIYPPQAQPQTNDTSRVFEFSGAEILERWGIEAYPFTPSSIYKAEYELQKREVTLQWFFRLGECLLRRPRRSGDGFDLVDARSQLLGKKVLVLFGLYSLQRGKFVSMLKSVYGAQLEDNVAEDSMFEVVYFSTGPDELTKDMPWLVHPCPSEEDWYRLWKAFKPSPQGSAALAFNEQGKLIAKEDLLDEKVEGYHLQFPFIDPDLEKHVRAEVEALCNS